MGFIEFVEKSVVCVNIIRMFGRLLDFISCYFVDPSDG